MSWYRIMILISLCFNSMLQAKELMKVSDDALLVRAILSEEYKAYENARQLYAALYDTTHAKVYLFKEAKASLLGQTHIQESITRLNHWGSLHPNALETKRLLIPLYLTSSQIELAKNQAEYLVERSQTPLDLELASNPFLYSGEFERALAFLSKIYAFEHTEVVLLRMVDIMDEYTGDRKNAIQLLETHRRLNVSSNDIYVKLLVLYSKEKDIAGLLETYKVLYERTKDEKILEKIIDTYAYTRDTLGAISFLEKNNVGYDLLYELYKSKKFFAKALRLAKKQYKVTKKPQWMAEQAIMTFEKSQDKNDIKMMHHVINIFDKALDLGVDDSIYLNYYGYILIDKDINVSKGIQIITDALHQQPDNTYYLDSLAWGYYKLHQCGKSYKLMNRVVHKEGLEEQEIKEHWDAIKQCR